MPNGLPAFQPARGINADMLFAEKITDEDERFKRLENAVTDMRREFDSVMPAIVRLSAVEDDMQTLLTQLQTLTQGGPGPDMTLDSAPVGDVTADALPPRPFPDAPENAQPPPASPGPVETLPAIPGLNPDDQPGGIPPPPASSALPQAPPAEEIPPVPSEPEQRAKTGKATVQSIRTGEQPGGVNRIVLDLTGPASHHSDLDNEEHLLLVEIPETGWSASPAGTFANAPLLTSWTTEPLKDGKGIRLIIQLSQNVRIISDSSLNDPDRIVLDLKKSP